jgi:hypothetical protein
MKETLLVNLSNYTNHSGGANGSDSEWDIIGKEYGMINNKHYYAEGEKTPKGNTMLDKTQLLMADSLLKETNKILKRTFPARSEFINNLLRRNYYQVINSESIFAISSIINNLVSGGTGWAVHMGILLNKPVFVYDQNLDEWFTWDNNFIKTEIPILTVNFAGIGTREIDEKGKQNIRNVYIKTLKLNNENKSII